MLAVRKRHRAFGRGAQRFLYPGNRKVLAYLRVYQTRGREETILCVYNLARTAQAVELELADYAGRVPVDLLGGSGFPPIGRLPYLLTLPPYGFYWFILATEAALPPWHVRPSEPLPELATLVLRSGLERRAGAGGEKNSRDRGAAGLSATPPLVRRQGPEDLDRPSSACGDKIPGRSLEIAARRAGGAARRADRALSAAARHLLGRRHQLAAAAAARAGAGAARAAHGLPHRCFRRGCLPARRDPRLARRRGGQSCKVARSSAGRARCLAQVELPARRRSAASPPNNPTARSSSARKSS